MTVTWIVSASRLGSFPKKVLYWDGASWVDQMWDAAHFESEKDAGIFIETRCDLNKKTGWIFSVMPVDSGMSY